MHGKSNKILQHWDFETSQIPQSQKVF